MAEENFTSAHGQIMLALRELVKSLQPASLADEEVQIRNTWLQGGGPIRGVTLYDPSGEHYSEGVNTAQDIGYIVALVFVQFRDGDARLTNDSLWAWMELVRRRLADQRLGVTIVDATDPREHVCRVLRSGENLSNPNKYPNYNIRRLVVAVWLREGNPVAV